MLGDPLLHLDSQPKTVNAEGDEGQKEPLDVVAEQLTSRAVKGQSFAVDDGVLGDPSLLDAYSPGEAQAESEGDDQALQNADADHAEKSACEFRFHKSVLLMYVG